jgi:hypothetical protein
VTSAPPTPDLAALAAVAAAAHAALDDLAEQRQRETRAYAAGQRDGQRTGRDTGWADGYRAGFTAGLDIGGAQTLLGVQHALPDGVLLTLLPDIPHTGEYQRLQRLRQTDNQPCRRGCRRCSACARAGYAARNTAVNGAADHPGQTGGVSAVHWATGRWNRTPPGPTR